MSAQNRLQKIFSGSPRNLLSVFYTAGYPNLGDTVVIAQALEAAGADIIEIGIPFSDPVADGPVIQESNHVALGNGMNLRLLLDQVREIRKTVHLPIVLMGYLNPVLQYGVENFCRDAAAAGVDGLILPDMPLEEYEMEYKAIVQQNGLCNMFLISPTTSMDRIWHIDALTDGFIYAVSSSSTTGARGSFSEDQLAYFERLRASKLTNPFLIGFGISDGATFSAASSYGAGAIVGSAFISMLKQAGDLPAGIHQFVGQIRKGSPPVV
ncbi:MAG TPA: tryptophan synthase subunit alpha [Cyclobacteriaceae bacterium]|nr:tryptophan synthase subunit alpha [Cyclobacteriaceae bacterium]